MTGAAKASIMRRQSLQILRLPPAARPPRRVASRAPYCRACTSRSFRDGGVCVVRFRKKAPIDCQSVRFYEYQIHQILWQKKLFVPAFQRSLTSLLLPHQRGCSSNRFPLEGPPCLREAISYRFAVVLGDVAMILAMVDSGGF